MTGVETEIKLLASPAMLTTLRCHPLLAGAEQSSELITTYFDTPDGRLHRAGANLRLRRSDGRQEQTFKQSARPTGKKAHGQSATGGSAIRRAEANAPVTGDRPDPAAFPPDIAAPLTGLLDGTAPAAFAELTVRRTTRKIRHGATLIEVAFDTGQITAAGRHEAICELELELIEGELVGALALALELPLGPDLRWSIAGKGDRAFALAHGKLPEAIRPGTAIVTDTMRVADAFRAICWNCLDHLLANTGVLIASASNEALHQCRVGIRRLRAALSLFAGSIDSLAATRFQNAFRSIATAMGAARELHVLLEALAQADEKTGLMAGGETAGLIPELTARRDAALAAVSAQLAGEDFQRLLLKFASWIETGHGDPTEAQPKTLPAFANRLLNQHRRKVRQAGRHPHAMTDDDLHRLRIKVKKLRYAVEFLSCLAAPAEVKNARKYAVGLAKLQDRLGALHDLSERSGDSSLFAMYEPARVNQLQAEMDHRLGPSAAARDELVDAAAHELAKLLDLPRWWQADREETDMAHGKDQHDGDQLKALQIRLTELQHRVIAEDRKLLVIFEGRDAAGKDGTIKRMVEHMSPRDTRVVAMGVPTEHDRKAWYFQRWCSELPVSGEIVLLNRSWYNRAGVERVMGFCSDAEYEDFMINVVLFEQLLIHSGFTLIKYYLDISKGEQQRRLRDRERDPLKQWKVSPIDKQATKNWKKYSKARNEMLARTHSVFAPWVVVKADDKPQAHLALIRDLLARCGEASAGAEADELPDPETVFVYDSLALEQGLLAK